VQQFHLWRRCAILNPSPVHKPIVIEGQPVNLNEGAHLPLLSPSIGYPAVVIPLPRDNHGLPIGAQVMGRRWTDERLFAIAELLSEVTGGYQRPPGY
jgi:amidase